MSNATGAAAAPPKYRPLTFGVTRVNVRGEDGGVQHLAADVPLQPFGERMSDRLVHWAKTTPDETFVAQRERLTGGQLGDWRRVSYAQTLDAARRIGQALIDRGLSQERPVVILSDNGIDHALLALGEDAVVQVGACHGFGTGYGSAHRRRPGHADTDAPGRDARAGVMAFVLSPVVPPTTPPGRSTAQDG